MMLRASSIYGALTLSEKRKALHTVRDHLCSNDRCFWLTDIAVREDRGGIVGPRL